MKYWMVTFNGHYIGGYSVIAAESRNDVEKLILLKLIEENLTLKASGTLDIKPIQSSKEAVLEFYNGDY